MLSGAHVIRKIIMTTCFANLLRQPMLMNGTIRGAGQYQGWSSAGGCTATPVPHEARAISGSDAFNVKVSKHVEHF